MAAKTGLAGKVLLNDAALTTIQLTKWSLEEKGTNVVTGGCGDTHVTRRPLLKDWKADCEGEVQTGTNFDLHADDINEDTVIALFIDEDHTNPYAEGTGLMTVHRVDVEWNQPIKVAFTVECSGTALTKDLTPAT